MKRGPVVGAATGAGLLAYGAVLNRLLPEWLHPVANLTAAMGAVALTRRDGITIDDLGLTPRRLPAGAALGAAAAAPVCAAIAVGVAVPATRDLFLDERVTAAGRGEASYHVLVRIPFSTALSEEVLFRGVLPATMGDSPAARMAAALVFGVWHVLPALEMTDAHHRARDAKAGVVAATVAATTVAGLGFAWLRRRSASLAAPVVAHTLINTTAYLAGRWATTRVHPPVGSTAPVAAGGGAVAQSVRAPDS